MLMPCVKDIIPPYGFIHKPSTTWPIHPLPDENGRARVVPTQTNPPPKPGHADTLQPNASRAESQANRLAAKSAQEGKEVHTKDLRDEHVGSQEEMLKSNADQLSSPDGSDRGGQYVASAGPKIPVADGDVDGLKDRDPGHLKQEDPQATFQEDRGKQARDESSPGYDPEFWEPKPPKVLMNDPDATPLELRSQIQLYATNE